jgi:tyrosine-protein kinase Etk/Wzc
MNIAKQQPADPQYYSTTGNDEPINFRAVFIRYRSYWPLFFITLTIALAAALVYMKYGRPVYQIMATLEIQDSNDKPAPEKSPLVDFQQLDEVNAPKVVENEMEILKSNQIIKQVVDNFQLWADYKVKGGIIKDQDLYGLCPIKLNVLKPVSPLPAQKIELQIIDTDSYALKDAKNNSKTHRFGDTITTGIGSWSITKDNNDIKPFVGSVIEIGIADPETTVLSYQNSLNVEAQEKPATVVNISIADGNVKRGEDFINYLIYFYKQAEVAEKNRIAKNTLQFIDRRLDSLSGQLTHAENNIEGYRSQNELTDVNAQSQIYLQEMQTNGDKLNEIKIQLNIISQLEDYLNQPGNGNVPTTAGIADQHLAGLVQKLSDVELERNKLLANTPEKNPAFEPLDNQVATLKQGIREDIKNIKSSLLTTQESLQGFKSNVQSSIKNVPTQEHQLAGMGRQQSNKETLYNYLLQQREQISLTYASAASNARLVDAAHILPLKASKKYIPFGVALLAGLILPAGFIYSKGLVKNAIIDKREIEHTTGIPVIAEFGFLSLASPIVFNNKNKKDIFILIEQFRHLRSRLSLLYSSDKKGALLTLITSGAANEGKTFISCNLAVSLANASQNTILLETDIYKPKVGKAFSLKDNPGLTDYLNGKATIRDIINQSEQFPNLSIVTCGGFIDNFSELLDQELFRVLIEELRTKFDHVLFDTSPVHSINDGFSIGKYCDDTLYVVRYDQTSRALLPFIGKLRTENLLPHLSIIFNGITGGRDSEGFKYQNYYAR